MNPKETDNLEVIIDEDADSSEVTEAFVEYGMREKGMTRAQVEELIAKGLAELNND